MVNIGDEVSVRFRAFPYQKFGVQSARIVTLSPTALPMDDAQKIMPDLDPSDRYFRATVSFSSASVKVYGSERVLRGGMAFDADVKGEKRSLIEWVLEPLHSVSGRI